MILQFSVSNFRAFRKMQTLNLEASNYDKSLSENCISSDLPGLKNRRWLKAVAIYGPNASGKTAIIDALKTLTELVKNSAQTTDPSQPINAIEPFALAEESASEPTAFALVFVADNARYEYRLAATRDRVWHESLRAFPTAKAQMWFCRDWEPEKGAYTWTPAVRSGYQRDEKREEFTLSNALFLSTAVKLADKQLEPIFRWFTQRIHFLDLSAKALLAGQFSLEQIMRQTPLATGIIRLLQQADLGVSTARAKVLDMPKELREQALRQIPEGMRPTFQVPKMLVPELLHDRSEPGAIPLPWARESAGTQRLFDLAGPWLDILEKGYALCVDELETSMHPLLVRELLRVIFKQERPNGAQLIFTTHNPMLLDLTLLRRDQIWFTEKDKRGEAHFYPMTDYAPRKGESLIRGYLAGRYGAVPFIPEGLLGSFSEAGIEKLAATNSDE